MASISVDVDLGDALEGCAFDEVMDELDPTVEEVAAWLSSRVDNLADGLALASAIKNTVGVMKPYRRTKGSVLL